MKPILIGAFSLVFAGIQAQSYTSYFTGNSTDISSTPSGGICLMGGASESDSAMRWFLQRANGGDILVIRASGSDGYNDYLFSDLGVPVNSVETIVFHHREASYDSYVQDKVRQAEAIWIAGGDQWKYVSYWRNSPIDSLINDGIRQRNIVIGGTSAGMAIQGGVYFSAENGTITSSTALSNPYHHKVSIDSSRFIQHDYLAEVITDTHYGERNRKGRHSAFLARMSLDYGMQAKGIACDEYTAVCLDENGIARVFGGHPQYNDNAYFIQTNCTSAIPQPENCVPNQALQWNRNGEALKVYRVKGTANGSYTFDLNDWSTGQGGTWLHWSVVEGNFIERPGSQVSCLPLAIDRINEDEEVKIFPNPTPDQLTIQLKKGNITYLSLRDFQSKLIIEQRPIHTSSTIINLDTLPTGIYILMIQIGTETISRKLIKK